MMGWQRGRKHGVSQRHTLGLDARKLIKRLQNETELDIPEGTMLERLYHGHNQKAAGAWAWCLYHPNHFDVSSIGGIILVRTLAYASGLHIYYGPGGAEVYSKDTPGTTYSRYHHR